MKQDRYIHTTNPAANENRPLVLVLDVARRAEAAARDLAAMATTASERRLVGLILEGAMARAGLA
ncbi:MAG TPA: hypothetical protein PLX84_09180 [Acidiphilium sp.]|nr:hypothetical protein [Acidiphilium sp.]